MYLKVYVDSESLRGRVLREQQQNRDNQHLPTKLKSPHHWRLDFFWYSSTRENSWTVAGSATLDVAVTYSLPLCRWCSRSGLKKAYLSDDTTHDTADTGRICSLDSDGFSTTIRTVSQVSKIHESLCIEFQGLQSLPWQYQRTCRTWLRNGQSKRIWGREPFGQCQQKRAGRTHRI